MFVTSQGHAHARFRRSLESGSVTNALAAAGELKPLGLTDSLELVLLLRDKAPERFGRAALRWHGRYCRETSNLELEEALAVLGLLGTMGGPRSKVAAFALADLLSQRRGSLLDVRVSLRDPSTRGADF
jgi:hypothetical protein